MADDGISIDIQGLSAIKDQLDALTKEASDRAIRKALMAGAVIEKAAIEERAPTKVDAGGVLPPNALRNDIVISMRRDELGELIAVVGPAKLTRWIARLVEYGHRMVTGGRSRLLASGKTKGPGVQVGEVAAHPFIRPAYEASRQQVADAICATLAAEVTAAAKRAK